MLTLLAVLMLGSVEQFVDPGEVVWLERPTGEQAGKAISLTPLHTPDTRVDMACTITTRGTLSECEIINVDGADTYAAAALKLSPIFRLRVQSRTGSFLAGRRIKIPFRFQTNGD